MVKSTVAENQGRSYDAAWEELTPQESAYRDALGDGLEIVLGDGAETIEEIVAGLNEHNIHGPKGQPWTKKLLETELERLSR